MFEPADRSPALQTPDQDEPSEVERQNSTTAATAPTPTVRPTPHVRCSSELATAVGELRLAVQGLTAVTADLAQCVAGALTPAATEQEERTAAASTEPVQRRDRMLEILPHLLAGLVMAGIAIAMTLYLFAR